jgi:hypothetical protein
MLPYWTLFLIASSGAAIEGGARKFRLPLTIFLAGLCAYIVLFVGSRDNIGADWWSYMRVLYLATDLSSAEALATYEPGYMLINIISARMGGEMLGANLAIAAIFAIGLCRFCLTLPRPLLALAISIPYLVIVVAMGYNRQSAAIGILLFALPMIERGHLWR